MPLLFYKYRRSSPAPSDGAKAEAQVHATNTRRTKRALVGVRTSVNPVASRFNFWGEASKLVGLPASSFFFCSASLLFLQSEKTLFDFIRDWIGSVAGMGFCPILCYGGLHM